jgi:hypothetical protein
MWEVGDGRDGKTEDERRKKEGQKEKRRQVTEEMRVEYKRWETRDGDGDEDGTRKRKRKRKRKM